MKRRWMSLPLVALAGLAAATAVSAQAGQVPPPAPSSAIAGVDLFHLRTVTDPQISPDGRQALFTVLCRDRIGPPYSRIFVADLAGGKARPWGSAEGVEGSAPRWSPDGRKVAYRAKDGLVVAAADGSGAKPLAPIDDTNDPLPRMGEDFTWSPDSSRIAFVSAVPGPLPKIEGDPIVVTRYWYRPARGWPTRFNDNKLLHIFIADVASGQVTQLTHGDRDEHSVDWSPDGKTILFVSNPEADKDFVYNYDLFTADVATGALKQLTRTKAVEFFPRWSPDGRSIAYSGLNRDITSSESNVEDPHVWTLDPATGARRELGAVVDNVQGPPRWSPDGRWLYFTVMSEGSVGLYRLPVQGGAAERVGPAPSLRGSVSTFDVGRDGSVVAAMATPKDLAELYDFKPRAGAAPAAITALNADLLGRKRIGEVRAFTFDSYDGRPVEAFLTLPPGFDPGARHAYPMILEIHGGPHYQQGPAYDQKSQVFAAQGWAVLAVNYRGSNGYGQQFANLIERDQDGGEGMDVLRGVDAALARYPAIDPDRLGIEGASYGGQLTDWLVTQTTRFKAGIPWAGISNIVSHNYMSVYHDYLEQEYFFKPHENGVNDMLWSRSPIRFVANVKTPMMLSHGDNDLLVNPAEDEQYFIALHDVGTEAIMLRYPREGHGMVETQHLVDFAGRSIDWYKRHFDPSR